MAETTHDDRPEVRQAREPIVEVYEEPAYDDGRVGRPAEWRWRLRGANGEVMCAGEGHRDSHDAIRAATRVEDAFAARPNLVVLRSRDDA